MTYLSEITHDTFKVYIEKPAVHTPTNNIIVRSRMGKVYLAIGDKVIELTTIVAHKLGMTIIKLKLDYNEVVILEINKEKFEFLWPIAEKVAAGLLRKADDADDWQLNNRRYIA